MPSVLVELEGALWQLHDILSEEQEQDGFAAYEDEDFIYIKRFVELCLTFSSSGATRGSIQQAVESIRKGRMAQHSTSYSPVTNVRVWAVGSTRGPEDIPITQGGRE